MVARFKHFLTRFVEAWQSGGSKNIFSIVWTRFWMRFAGLSRLGRISTHMATWFAPPYFGRYSLANLNSKGYIAPSATICHANLQFGHNVFIDDRVVIFQATNGRVVKLGERVHILRDTIIQTGDGGSVTIGANTYIQPRCTFSAFKSPIQIGCGVQIAPNCAFYSYDHSFAPDELISRQPLKTKGGIIIDDDAWLGFGVIVLDGVRIGKGSVVGAGSVVTRDVPDNAIAFGVPARIVRMRSDLNYKTKQQEIGCQ